MEPTVVYVHGNGNKPPEDVLKRIWDVALFGAPAGARSRMAYWADLRYPGPLPAHETDGLAMPPGGEEGVVDDDLHPEELVVEAMMQAQDLVRQRLLVPDGVTAAPVRTAVTALFG